jgi:RNA polymerase sigma-70 factor (ECF subfamily)
MQVVLALVPVDVRPFGVGALDRAIAAGRKALSIAPRRAIVTGRRPARAHWAMVEASDEDLMAEVAGGNQRAFQSLAARHQGRAFRIAYRLVRQPADAEEIVQDALLRTWVNAPSWRPSASFATWLYRVVVNLALDRQRYRKRRGVAVPLEEADTIADPAPDAVDRMARGERDRAVQAALDALPERQRAALVLVHYEELSNAEAAEVLGTSVGGIESLLVRARRSLRERLAPLLG